MVQENPQYQKLLVKLGYKVFESDKEVSLIFNDNTIIKKVITLFNKKIDKLVNSNGSINKIALGNYVFSNRSELVKLEKIIHPLISKKKEEVYSIWVKTKNSFFLIFLSFLRKRLFEEFNFIIYLYIDKKKLN